jgi:uncharacterized repeat protein (TIGR03803 family)
VSKLNWLAKSCGVFLIWATAALPASAQTFTTLHNFCSRPDCTDGAVPTASLVQGTDGNLYGTTPFGGASGPCDNNFGCGTMFRITPDGALTTVYAFCSQAHCTDGAGANALIQDTNGDLYGTTVGGGAYWRGKSLSSGTVFRITLNGELTTLYNFCPAYPTCTDGRNPTAALVQGRDGKFVGTTFNGGEFNIGTCIYGCGTVFRVTPGGALESMDSFDVANGQWPLAGMIQGADGRFYGATEVGGSGICGIYCDGTVFSISVDGTLTTLYDFCSLDGEHCTDGSLPFNGVVEGPDGNLYGATYEGGSGTNCTPIVGCGTIFKLTPGGTLTTLYSFCSVANCTDGEFPYAGLVLGSDGRFYGTTVSGGANGFGTVFEITRGGVLTTLHSFDGNDGELSEAALVQGTDGSFYGTMEAGGKNHNSHCGDSSCGTVFKLSVGLVPFVEPLPAVGNVGAIVKILGTSLTGATSVAFHGSPAVFTVVSSSLITTTVPTGATTGEVQVSTPQGNLKSNLPFTVLP